MDGVGEGLIAVASQICVTLLTVAPFTIFIYSCMVGGLLAAIDFLGKLQDIGLVRGHVCDWQLVSVLICSFF